MKRSDRIEERQPRRGRGIADARQVRAFLAETATDKRAKKIDELLARPCYTALWATKFCDILRPGFDPRNGFTDAAETRRFYEWLRARMKENTPYDQLAERVLLATSLDGRTSDEWVREVRAMMEENTALKPELKAYATRRTLDLYWQLSLSKMSSAHVFSMLSAVAQNRSPSVRLSSKAIPTSRHHADCLAKTTRPELSHELPAKDSTISHARNPAITRLYGPQTFPPAASGHAMLALLRSIGLLLITAPLLPGMVLRFLRLAFVPRTTLALEILSLRQQLAAFLPASARMAFSGGTGVVTSASFSVDVSRVVTWSQDQTAKVWDARPVSREFLP